MQPRILAGLALGSALWMEQAGPLPAPATRWTPAAISTDRYESSPTFTPDGREIYLMQADRNFDNYRLVWSRCLAAGWSSPTPVPFAAADGVLEADPFVTIDGRSLYYVSTRADPRREDLDIWVVDRRDGGEWGTPQRLPAPVNSDQPELLPRVTAAGQLYFGSSRRGGFGQGDIYRATRIANGTWTVSNVGPPVSSPANEFEAEISRDGRHLALVADRGARSHLYRFQLVADRWTEIGQVPADDAGFQVGPLFSPWGDRLLFAQRDGTRSGELFVVDLVPTPNTTWPPRCPAQ
jgi:Tol biopolymer transport system component